MSVDLRSYVFLDSLQSQHAAFLGTVAREDFCRCRAMPLCGLRFHPALRSTALQILH